MFLSKNNLGNRASDLPEFEFAFSADIDLGPIQDKGEDAHGHIRFVPIIGGHFEGPFIKGMVERGGGDLQMMRKDKVLVLNAEYVLKTDDDALIHVKNTGYRHGKEAVLERLANGEIVGSDEYYFRTTPKFETSSKKYDYLNKYIFVAKGERKANSVLIHFFKLL
jgi:hypothetical protein